MLNVMHEIVTLMLVQLLGNYSMSLKQPRLDKDIFKTII